MLDQITFHFNKCNQFKYVNDYVNELDINEVQAFLLASGNPHKEESDLRLRMIWEIHEINDAKNTDKYFQEIGHYD